MSPFARTKVLVGGSAELANAIVVSLRRHGQSVRLWSPRQQGGRPLKSAETLILADPADPAVAIAEAVELCGKRAKSRPPLRLILVYRRGPAPVPSPSAGASRVRIEYFALEDRAARWLLARYPLHTDFDPRFGQSPHLLIAGTAPPADSLLLQALRVSRYSSEPAQITLACARPERDRCAFFERYPQAGQVAKLSFTPLEAPVLDGAPPVTSVYVCLTPAERGLITARRLIDQIRAVHGISPLVHLEVGETVPDGKIVDWDGQILPFSYLNRMIEPEVLLGDRGGELARLVHAHYRDTTAAQGRDPSLEPAGQDWDVLDE